MIFSFDDFELDPDKPELRRFGKPVKADAMVLRLLVVLVRDAGRLVTKSTLLSRVWDDRSVSDNVVTVAMARLRRTLGHQSDGREFVVNVHGQGYRFVRPVVVRAGELAPAVASDVRAPHAVAAGDAAPFVGRERALERLRTATLAMRDGRGGVCVVTGEPGIGKTRLVEVLAQEAAALGIAVAWGHCHEAGHTPPLWPFAQLLRELFRSASLSPNDARLLGARGELQRLLPELAGETVPREPSARLLDYASAGQHRIFDAISRALLLCAEHTPCVLVLDDLHRADAPSLELLHYFSDQIARTRVLVIATIRAEAVRGAGAGLLSAVLGHRNCQRVALERLGEGDVAAYVSALLDDTSGALSRAVFEKSEGNPFFMAELARQLVHGDRAAVDGQMLALPEAAIELMRQRMAALDDATRGVLSCAAVVGRSFEVSLLQAATERDGVSLMASLDEALAWDVVVAAPDSKTAFAFGHELFRDALYDALAPSERRRWHLCVARALHDRVRAGDAIAPAELAHHFFSALPESDLKLTVRYCSDAAGACAEVYAFADAVRHMRHAREALGLLEQPNQHLRLGLMVRQAMYMRVVSSAEFMPLIHEVMDGARKLQLGAPLALAALLSDVHTGFPPLRGARAALEDALRFLPEDDLLRSAVLARLATSAPLAYDAEQSTERVAQALALARSADFLLGEYTARSAQLYLLGGPAHEAQVPHMLRELEDLCERHPATLSIAPLLLDLHRAISAAQRGDHAAVSAALDRCELRGRRVGGREMLWHVERFRILSRLGAGDAGVGATQSLDALRALHERAEHERLAGTEELCAYDQSVVLRVALTDDARNALAFDAGDPPNVWSIKLRALTAAGLHDDARRGLQAIAPERLARLPCDRDYLGTLGALARVAIALDAREYIEPLRALLAPYSDRVAINVAFVSEGTVAEIVSALERA